MSSTDRIGIVGCGIGGLALAIALRQQGRNITLFDRFETPQPVGSGLVIQPVGQSVLSKIGVLAKAKAKGRPIYQLRGHESRNQRVVLRANYGPWNGQTFGLAIHRSDLFDVLYSAVKTSGARVLSATPINATTLTGGERTLLDDTGQTHGPFDLVVDASGASSKLSSIRRAPLPYGALWGTVDWPHRTPIRPDCLTQCYKGADKMLGVLPLSEDGRTAIFWSEPTSALPFWKERDLNDWKEEAVDLWPDFEPFVSQIQRHEGMTVALYHHGTLTHPYGERIAFIGDAAHQTSPQLGQGANMALLDALALAEAVESVPLIEAPARYARKRRAHVRFYQAISRIFTPFYQSSNPAYPWVRNNLVHPVSQIWPANRLLSSLISGRFIPTGL